MTQIRNVHSYTADLQAEIPLYTKAEELTLWLNSWNKSLSTCELTIAEMYKDLYEIGVIEIEDVVSLQAWLDDLRLVGYNSHSHLGKFGGNVQS